MAEGQTAIAALHAAALQPELFASVTLKNASADWTTIAGSPNPVGQLDDTIHGVLKSWDLPDLEPLISGLIRR